MTILATDTGTARLRAQIAEGAYIVPDALLAAAILDRLASARTEPGA